MASIRKRGEYQWTAQIEMKNRATGLVHKEIKTFQTKDEADTWAMGVEADLRRSIHHDTRIIDSTLLSKLIQKYIEEVSPRKLGSAQEIVRLKAWLKRDLADKPLSRCTPKDFADYIAERRKAVSKRGGNVSEQTIKHEIITISNVFESARKDWGYDIQNPTKQISKPGGSQARDVRIVPEDWTKIAAWLTANCRNTQYVVIAEFAIETGMREDEIFRMTWGDIDLTARKIIVDGKDTSSTGQRKPRTVPVSARAAALLKKIPRDVSGTIPVFQIVRQTGADGLSRAFTAACAAIGLKGGCFHCTRHEAASRMAPHYPMLTLMAIFGWKTPSMAARYYHASDEDLLAGIDKLHRAQKSAKSK